MALTLGTNCGFVTASQTNDPTGGSTLTIDGVAGVMKVTAPSNAVMITEMGWWCNTASEAANFQLGLYAADGATVPGEAGTRLYTSGDIAKGTGGNAWKKTGALTWTITPGATYWLGVQLDNVTTTTTIDRETTGGPGYDTKTSQTSLTDPFGGGTLASGTGKLAIYAVYTTNDPPTVALNSPSDTATGVSTTPTLNFTGTDADGDAVEYEVQIDEAPTFDSH